MKFQKINNNNGCFEKLFGTIIHKNTPLCVYAEHLFYCGMEQMTLNYQGGNFTFVKLINTDDTIKVEPTGFLPLLEDSQKTVVKNPFKKQAIVSTDAACLIVWIFVLQQIAETIDNESIKEKLYNTMEDFNFSYSEVKKDDDSNYFDEDDWNGIYQLLN